MTFRKRRFTPWPPPSLWRRACPARPGDLTLKTRFLKPLLSPKVVLGRDGQCHLELGASNTAKEGVAFLGDHGRMPAVAHPCSKSDLLPPMGAHFLGPKAASHLEWGGGDTPPKQSQASPTTARSRPFPVFPHSASYERGGQCCHCASCAGGEGRGGEGREEMGRRGGEGRNHAVTL